MLTNLDLCLSGGANGADTAWGLAALDAKHELVHWTFKGYRYVEYSSILTDDKLQVADEYLKIANKSLKRQWPSRTTFINNLLRRNYYQVYSSDAVYAVGSFTNDSSLLKIRGGTAWACQMYVDRWLYSTTDSNMNNCQLYFFDQDSKGWNKWNQVWQPIDAPPRPSGVYAGIGTRDISDAGLTAIIECYR